MLEHKHAVDAAVLERQLAVASAMQRALGRLAGQRQLVQVVVHRHHVGARWRSASRVEARPAAEVDDPLAGSGP